MLSSITTISFFSLLMSSARSHDLLLPHHRSFLSCENFKSGSCQIARCSTPPRPTSKQLFPLLPLFFHTHLHFIRHPSRFNIHQPSLTSQLYPTLTSLRWRLLTSSSHFSACWSTSSSLATCQVNSLHHVLHSERILTAIVAAVNNQCWNMAMELSRCHFETSPVECMCQFTFYGQVSDNTHP